jgi:hypothetical protein
MPLTPEFPNLCYHVPKGGATYDRTIPPGVDPGQRNLLS